jgi:hypothetical protein
MGIDVVGVKESGTECGEGGGKRACMSGALSSAVTGCDVVNGGGEASDDGAAKVISSIGVERRGVGCIGVCCLWIDVTVRMSRRPLDLWSGNSVLRA